MKVLVAGDWHSELHEEAVSSALDTLEHQVVRFQWHQYFEAGSDAAGRIRHYWKRAQNKYLFGPLVRRLNTDLIALAEAERPDIVFVYRGTHVFADTLKAIKTLLPETILVGYNNDDPFSPRQPRWLWRHFLESLKYLDLTLAYRHHNIQEFRAAGAKRVELLRSWFIPERNHPIDLSPMDKSRFGADVVFIGHYENDGRLALLETLAQRGWQVRLFGPGYEWDSIIADSNSLRHLMPVELVWGDDYNRALCGAKLAICFLSKLNRDTYTRRCFEIPASGTVLVSEHTDDLAQLFEEGEEAAFFNSHDEAVEKIEFLLQNDEVRNRMAIAGHKKVVGAGHDVISRMRQLLGWVDEIRHAGQIK